MPEHKEINDVALSARMHIIGQKSVVAEVGVIAEPDIFADEPVNGC